MHDRNVVSATPLKEPAPRGEIALWLQRTLRDNARNIGLLVCLIASIAFVSARSPTYLSYDNLLVVSLQMAFVGIAALGTTALI
ncbi:MAG: hypothetical protein QOD65_3077, partial [Gaiellales bacterium]|nr:hypothetical protein [Gaiellales bacterium]